MSSYEIRVSEVVGVSPPTIVLRRVSDSAAIRSARRIAKAGNSVEVWKGGECIYSGTSQAVLQSPSRRNS